MKHVISECIKLAQKEYESMHNYKGKAGYSEILQKIKIRSCQQMVQEQIRICSTQ